MTTRLENLEAMLEAATPGPWTFGSRRPSHGHANWVYDATDDIICTVANKPTRGMDEANANVDLIAAAPQALRDLIPCVKALKALIETMESVTTGACDVDAGLTDGRRALQQFESGSVPPSGDPSVER